ncbi:E3 ubiquitin-protein ligase SIS3-like isoform X2 [Magnolia sinica]|uniref:E3 ubiquitin-protein ligase SIS3-like isoform X2 n=1 Tax=Magnolia sinica TaxID=86752 RepID=UPI0026591289|nr:E3 ubiquitin-protein ligase SIS3-like isoform X2 [Magnolia sinica]
MAIKGVDFKWYDGFFLSMLATSVIIVSINWKRYHLCTYPLHIWIVVDYTTVFIFRLLMFIDNGLAAGMGLDLGWQQRYARFCGRIVVLSILSLLLYPFLWAWTVIGTLWFTSARSCLPEEGQKWGFLIWLLFSYCGLICIACMSIRKWLTRRQAHLLRAQQGIPISEYGVLVDIIRVPDWAFEAAVQELIGMGQDAIAYHPGLYLTATQVRGLPCAHNFHVECIDEWLRLNVKCPRCRCSVFPNLDLSALSNIHADSGRQPSASVVTVTSYVHTQPVGQSYLLRLQGLLRTIRTENVGGSNDDAGLEAAEDGQAVLAQGPSSTPAPVMSGMVMDRSLPPHTINCNSS